MKIMTWNIWGGKQPEAVFELLEREKPDVIALQEVSERDGVNIGKNLAEKLGYYVTYCKSFTTDRHTPVYDLGNAVLSKTPIISSTCHFLSTLEQYERSAVTEPRTAIECELLIHDKPTTFLTAHLGYSEGFTESDLRFSQLEKLLSLVKDENCILTGDFNSLPQSEIIKRISKKMKNTDSEMNSVSYTHLKDPNHPQFRIDYIFTSEDINTSNFRIITTEASDHYPLSIEII